MLKCDLASNLTVAAAKRGGLLLARLPKELFPAGAFRGGGNPPGLPLLLFLFVQTSMAHGVFILSLSLSPSSVC